MLLSKFLSATFTILILTSSICAQELIFPDNFTGRWKGELNIIDNNGHIKNLDMEIHIFNTASIDTFYYTLIYQNDQILDQRDYLIIKDQSNPRILFIDEKNGIVLEMEQFGNK